MSASRPGRSKGATPAFLKRRLGARNLVDIDRERLLTFGRERAAEDAGPMTLSIDIGMTKQGIEPADPTTQLGRGAAFPDAALGERERPPPAS